MVSVSSGERGAGGRGPDPVVEACSQEEWTSALERQARRKSGERRTFFVVGFRFETGLLCLCGHRAGEGGGKLAEAGRRLHGILGNPDRNDKRQTWSYERAAPLLVFSCPGNRQAEAVPKPTPLLSCRRGGHEFSEGKLRRATEFSPFPGSSSSVRRHHGISQCPQKRSTRKRVAARTKRGGVCGCYMRRVK